MGIFQGAFKVITKPKLNPITLDEAKDALRVYNFNDDDSRILGLIKTSTAHAENFSSLSLMEQTVERYYDRWPSYNFSPDVWPLQSIDTIAYYDTQSPSTEQTLIENIDYYTDVNTIGGRIITIAGWPSVAIKPNAIRVRMTAGYATQEEVPDEIKEAIKVCIIRLYHGEKEWEDVFEDLLWHDRVF